MSIINFDFCKSGSPTRYGGEPWPEGSYCPISDDYNTRHNSEGVEALVYWETYVGMCLVDREMNGYDDSDFYMTVWDEEKGEPKEIMFATTRGWTYPAMGSFVDATEEVRAKYEAYHAEQVAKARKMRRESEAKKLCEFRKTVYKLSEKYGVPAIKFRIFLRSQRKERCDAVLKLFSTSLRSEFRMSLRNQIIDWLKAEENKYASPLSPRQWDYV